MALSPTGNKERTCVILTAPTTEYLDRQAAKYGISRSAYIRMLVVQDMEQHGEQPPEKGQIKP